MIREEAQVRDLFVLLDEARPALVEAYEPELWFIVEWRDGPRREFYVGPDWVAPVQTGLQDAVSGWRLRSQSFQAALVLALDHGCFQPLPPNKALQQTGESE